MENEVTIIAVIGEGGTIASCWTTVKIDDIALEAFIVATERKPCPCPWGHYCLAMENALDQLLPSATTGTERESDPTPGGP